MAPADAERLTAMGFALLVGVQQLQEEPAAVAAVLDELRRVRHSYTG